MQQRRSEAARAMDRVQAVVHAFHELSDDDKDVFLDLVDPLPVESEPVKKKPAKQERKIEHCVACDYTRRAAVHKDPLANGYHEFQSGKSEKSERKSSAKSPRGQGILEAIQRTPKTSIVSDGDHDDKDDERCVVMRDGRACGLLPDHNVHHLQSAMGYHGFDAGKPVAETEKAINT